MSHTHLSEEQSSLLNSSAGCDEISASCASEGRVTDTLAR